MNLLVYYIMSYIRFFLTNHTINAKTNRFIHFAESSVGQNNYSVYLFTMHACLYHHLFL
ncbi:hypothetical protein Desdi_2180 [Desulfitobacterium dichloroeliminans LMG P-21439]|uniref:Uncharacterized protein n=1 Tax=Desulfitobacterium dichloroeliminans (strain LMG P-21439 / DCA1) TaxID=871963 RepID=L0FAE6_DESDL|nr:hypothetical protein Desdi_2180 [Desulfitobacterium dichloroeliminans LMG P-21439]